MPIFRRSDAENYIGELDELLAVDLLQPRYRATDRALFQGRRQALRSLFAALSPQVATYFYGKLRQKRRQDQLSRLFYGRLAGATRRELLCILQRRMSNRAITPQSCRNSASQTEFETQLAAAATEVEREMENAAEWMSQDQRRPRRCAALPSSCVCHRVKLARAVAGASPKSKCGQ